MKLATRKHYSNPKRYELRWTTALLLLLQSLGTCASALASTDHTSFDRLIEENRTSGVPQRIQVGGTCGLYALGMVMDFWHQLDPKNPTFLVSDSDVSARGTQFNYDPTSPERILNYVQASQYSRTGEMFVASTLAETARHFGYEATLYSHATLVDIYRALDQRHPVIVAFDVDDQGNPGLFRGEKAHYAVLEGYFDFKNTRYLIARHGWGGKKDYVWKASRLFASMNNLKYTDYYPSIYEEPKGIHLPSYAGHTEWEDISESLGDKIIEVTPEN